MLLPVAGMLDTHPLGRPPGVCMMYTGPALRWALVGAGVRVRVVRHQGSSGTGLGVVAVAGIDAGLGA